MIKGIGTDIVSLKRINQVRLKHIGFSKRILTPNEEKLYLKNLDLTKENIPRESRDRNLGFFLLMNRSKQEIVENKVA